MGSLARFHPPKAPNNYSIPFMRSRIGNTFRKYTSGKDTFRKYTMGKYTFGKNTFVKYTFGKYTFGKYTFRKYTLKNTLLKIHFQKICFWKIHFRKIHFRKIHFLEKSFERRIKFFLTDLLQIVKLNILQKKLSFFGIFKRNSIFCIF